MKCQYCGSELEDNPSSYYHRKDCQQRDVLKRLEIAKSQGASRKHIARLQDELERARYVGD